MKRENKILAVTGILCLASGPIFLYESDYKLTATRFLIILAVIAIYNLSLCLKKAETERRRCVLLCSAMGLFTMALMQGMAWVRLHFDAAEKHLGWCTILLFLVLSAWCLGCVILERGITENTVTMIIFAGFLFRLFYVVMTQGHLIQNDIESLTAESHGHLGYVYMIFSTGKLPDINPVGNYQFYQPPLYYFLAAAFLKVCTLLGAESPVWDELLQLLPVFFTTAILVFLNKIGLQLKCSPLGRCVTLGLAAFFPYSIFLGSALNNDPLVTLLIVMCVYYTIKWYEKPEIKNVLAMAVCIGCAMMTKLSGAMIAPAMAVVMLWRAWTDRQKLKKWIWQFFCFGVVAFPLGLWYPVLRWLQYRMPIGYIVPIPIDDRQFIGMYVGWRRFSNYAHALESLSLRWGPAPDVDYNIPVSLIKYSVFNELNYYNNTRETYVLGHVCFWATVVLFLLFVVGFLIWLCVGKQKPVYKVFLGAGVFTILFSYVKFCLMYPHVCSMNVRYVMAAVYIGMLALGVAISALKDRLSLKNALAGKIVSGAAVCLTSFYMIVYILLTLNLETLLF